MKKSVISVLAIAITVGLCLALIPKVLSQPENVDVLSYSWYLDPYTTDRLVVVGEAQNTGSSVIDYLTVTGTFYTTDGEAYMVSSTKSLVSQILPQQKTPFYLSFSEYNVVSGFDWGTQPITNFTITINYAGSTDSRQYQDLQVTSHSASHDDEGYYMVTGVVTNTGTQSTNQTWVLATFYNSTGSVVAVGYSNYLTPTSIAPGGTATFTLYPLDYAPVAVGQISSYSLVIQTKLSAASATPTPEPSSTVSPTPTATSSSPTSTPTPTSTSPTDGTTIPDTYVYAAIVAVIVVVAVVALVLRKRGGKRTATSQQAN